MRGYYIARANKVIKESVIQDELYFFFYCKVLNKHYVQKTELSCGTSPDKAGDTRHS